MKTFIQITISISLGVLLSANVWASDLTIPNSFTSGTPAVAAEVNGNFGAVETAVDDNNSRIAILEMALTALQLTLTSQTATISSLQSDLSIANGNISTLQADLSAVEANSVLALDGNLVYTLDGNGYATARFTGVNVQVLNGIDQTNVNDPTIINGLGNLIVGYNNPKALGRSVCSDGAFGDQSRCEASAKIWAPGHKSGSHNLIVGDKNSYSQADGVVFGNHNVINRNYANVTGGASNIASGVHSVVSGGSGNTASGDDSAVSGGGLNTASGPSASVSGGYRNTAAGIVSHVSGGRDNIADGIETSILGGTSQTIIITGRTLPALP